MKKYEVLAERVSLVVGKGSVVLVDDVQAELARQFLKPCEKVEVKEEKPVEEKPMEEKPEKKAKKK